jgi:hypothetical protein
MRMKFGPSIVDLVAAGVAVAVLAVVVYAPRSDVTVSSAPARAQQALAPTAPSRPTDRQATSHGQHGVATHADDAKVQDASRRLTDSFLLFLMALGSHQGIRGR